MGAIVVQRDAEIEAKKAKLATRIKSASNNVSEPLIRATARTALSSDKEILAWICQQATQLSETDSLVLNKAAVTNNGSLLFIPYLPTEFSLQATY